jgi:dipeptide/tripeptide permease
VYSLDYQSEVDGEYYSIFKEAGWNPVVSVNNKMHIFSAKAGTKPIYSDCISEIDKYTKIRDQTRRGTLYSSIIAIALIGLLVVSAIAIRPIFLIVFGLIVIDILIFIFNFMPYLAYKSRIKQLKKDGKCKSETIISKGLWKVYAFAGVIFFTLGIVELFEKKYFAVLSILLGIFYITSSLNHYKKYKKSLLNIKI